MSAKLLLDSIMFRVLIRQTNSLRNTMNPRPLDRTDRRILAALTNNARLSNKELAARIRLAPWSCHERVRRLTRSGALRGFHADVDPSALGFGIEAMIAVRLRTHTRENYERFRAYLLTVPEVVGAFHTSGEDDFLVHLLARDAHHTRDLAIDKILTGDEVGDMQR